MDDAQRIERLDLSLFNGHTPGPWVCHEMTREVEVEAPCGRMIWIGNVHSDDCVLADAQLIAAAPQMLAAITELYDAADAYRKARTTVDMLKAADRMAATAPMRAEDRNA